MLCGGDELGIPSYEPTGDEIETAGAQEGRHSVIAVRPLAPHGVHQSRLPQQAEKSGRSSSHSRIDLSPIETETARNVLAGNWQVRTASNGIVAACAMTHVGEIAPKSI